ncbi:spore protein YkvP [Calothrix sp. NIES-4071]|nr:spore protein YkvP [Calothrix sp. NIES-4071]BAZ56065.1 spore protein YkvP [Calothrix sp. NIES-4105]
MSHIHPIVHFIWMLPEHLDSNCHIREMLMSEAIHCDFTIQFYQSESYLQEATKTKQPELIILFGSFYKPNFDIYNLIAQARAYLGTRIAAWVTEDPYEFDCNYLLPKLVDFVFSNDKNSCNYYHSQNAYHLPLAASANNTSKPTNQPEWDFVFCGVGFPNRIDIIEGLQDILKNYSTLIIGSNWSTQIAENFFIRHQVDYDELLSIYRNSKIVLNLSRSFDIENKIYEIVPSTPAPRTFEVAALGIFQLVFFDRPELYEYFTQQEIISFSSKQEFAYLAEKYINNSQLRHNITNKAKQRVHSEHLYRHRLQTLVQEVFNNL